MVHKSKCGRSVHPLLSIEVRLPYMHVNEGSPGLINSSAGVCCSVHGDGALCGVCVCRHWDGQLAFWFLLAT